MTERKISRPWRVQRVGSVYEDFRSKDAAYTSALSLASLGFEIKVWHWENDDWRLYENVGPQAQHEMEAGG